MNYDINDNEKNHRSNISVIDFANFCKNKFFSNQNAVDVVKEIIRFSIEINASDIHIDPSLDNLIIKIRLDGSLIELCELPLKFHLEIITCIKVMSGLRIDGYHLLQDGRIHGNILKQSNIDIRVSIVPTIYGENAVLRVLGYRKKYNNLEDVGFSKEESEKILSALKRNSGMILITGPTGSGKTTTLYAFIRILLEKNKQIITLEDPVECRIGGARQIQVNPKTGLTFSNGLRSILRQDPNIIMVGEIRDQETAIIASHSALTGHLILSTLHTNSAAETFVRLKEMGVNSYLIATTVSLTVFQRLFKKICNYCRKGQNSEKYTDQYFIENNIPPPQKLYRGEGCEKCYHTGTNGRILISEIILVSKKIKQAIGENQDIRKILEIASNETGFKNIHYQALIKASLGTISFEEAISANE